MSYISKFFTLSILGTFFFYSCGETEIISVSGIEVTAYFEEVPLGGVIVFSNPQTEETVTDTSGWAIINNIEPGIYIIYASKDGMLSGQDTVLVNEAELTKVDIRLEYGLGDQRGPKINNLIPENNSYNPYFQVDNIVFSAKITDVFTPDEQIMVIYESDVDGIIYEGSPDSDGNVYFEYNNLSSTKHKITITAKNNENMEGTYFFNVSKVLPNPVVLEPILVEKNNSKLNWSRFQGDGFINYEIFRNEYDNEMLLMNSEKIITLSSIDDTTFIDECVPLVSGIEYYVDVKIDFDGNSERTSSNYEQTESPNGHVFSSIPSQILHHPTEHFIYLYFKYPNNKIVKFDYLNDEEIMSIELPSYNNGDGLISKNGDVYEFLYPAGDSTLYIYNIDDLSEVERFDLGWSINTISSDGKGNIYGIASKSGFTSILSIKRSNGEIFQNIPVSSYHTSTYIPVKNAMVFTSGFGIARYYTINFDGQLIIENGNLSINSDIFLNLISQSSPDGQFMIHSDGGWIYDTTPELNLKGILDSGDSRNYSFTISEDSKTIFSCIYEKNAIHVFDSSDLSGFSEIECIGETFFVAEYDNRLIVLYIINSSCDAGFLGGSSIQLIDL
ncbi:MAG: hypothetical protein ACI86M_003220 [Saprospiraceae bacterium]|jgi:hypothetical protein